MDLKSIYLLFIFCNSLKFITGDPCTVQTTTGQIDPTTASTFPPDIKDANATVLFVSSLYQIPCCGAIDKWEVVVQGLGRLKVQVWRPLAGEASKFVLLGENGFNSKSTSITLEKHRILPENQIQVAPGDYIAFSHDGEPTLRYTTCDPASPSTPILCSENVFYTTDVIVEEAGYVHEFTTLQSAILGVNEVRGYAITAHVNAKQPVTCSDKHKVIVDTLAIGERVAQMKTEFIDVYHPESVFGIDGKDPGFPVTIDTTTGEITVSGTLTPHYPSSEYKVTVRVTDVCTSSSTCILNIKVKNVAKPIWFTSLPASVEIDRTARSPLEIHSFTISRQRDIDNVTCFIQSSTPATDEIEIRKQSKQAYTVSLKMGASLDKYADQDKIFLLIHCENSGGEHNQTSLIISLFPKSASQDSNGNNFWRLGGPFIAAILLTAVAVIISACLVKHGKIKCWPDSKNCIKTDSVQRISHSDLPNQPNILSVPFSTYSHNNHPTYLGNGDNGNRFLDVPPSYQSWERTTSNTSSLIRSSDGSIGLPRAWEFQQNLKPPRSLLSSTYENRRLNGNTNFDITPVISPSLVHMTHKRPWKP